MKLATSGDKNVETHIRIHTHVHPTCFARSRKNFCPFLFFLGLKRSFTTDYPKLFVLVGIFREKSNPRLMFYKVHFCIP